MLVRNDSISLDSARTKRRLFMPDYIATSVAHIDFAYLKQRGITTAFIDLDGTVVPRATYDIDSIIRQALSESGLAIYIATNRPKSRDLKNLKEDLSATGVIHPVGIYGKPSTKYYASALRDHNLRASEVIMIGDRFLQDIFGANRAGLQTLLVNKIGRPHKYLDRIFSSGEEYVTSRISKSYRNSNELVK